MSEDRTARSVGRALIAGVNDPDDDVMSLGDRATVIFNAESGNGDGVGIEEIERCLLDQGLESTIHETESVEDLDEILADASGLVVTCGGDGMLPAVCAHGRSR